MILDLIILSLIVVFAVVGGFTGAARQLAQMAALAIGYLCARALGIAAGPRLAAGLHIPIILGVIVATILVFIAVMFTVRLLLTRLLRNLLTGGDGDSRGLDRALGFLLGGLKVTLLAYFMVSALSFVEDNVSLAGRRVGLSPKDSVFFSLARQYNLFEMIQYKPVKDLVRIADALNDPVRAERLRKDPAFRALKQDPRFQRSLEDQAMREALETGDYRGLLKRDEIVRMIQAPSMPARLRAAVDASR